MNSTVTPTWSVIAELPRREVLALATAEVPTTPGVYIWFRDGQPVYLGVARGPGGIRQRIRNHLATSTDLRQSTLRRSVAVAQLGVDRQTANLRPSVFTDNQVAVVNDWLRACQLTWIECDSPEAAESMETELLSQHRPLLNQR